MAMPGPPHAMKIEDVGTALGTSPAGLTGREAKDRLIRFGKNVLTEEKTSTLVLFLRQFSSVFVIVLIIAALLSLVFADVKDFFVIMFILVVNSLIGFWHELSARTSLDALKKLTESRVRVLRDGTLVTIPSSDLVPGDVVHLDEGDRVTADIRLTGTSALTIDESSLTGESLPVIKDHSALVPEEARPFDWVNMALSGTTVVRGSGTGYVAGTGSSTYFAGIATRAQEKAPESPLSRAVAHFSKQYITLLFAIFALLGAIALFQGREVGEVAFLIIALIVAAIPEGLPIVLTLVMVVGAMALNREKTLVRDLYSVETLGSATVIASDKTGTITKGQVAVQEIFAIDEKALTLCAALCNDTHEGAGDPIDVALSRWSADFDATRTRYPRTWSLPFDTQRRSMVSVNKVDSLEVLFIKGAFEDLLNFAENKEDFPSLEPVITGMAARGLRVLAFGSGTAGTREPASWKFRIVGIIGFIDPPREDVQDAVRTAKNAGIRVIMITGDHPLTAQEIGRSVHIWSEGDRVLAGSEIDTMDDPGLYAALLQSTVIARILPEHKYRVVRVLQDHGEIVAVTGDGVNDVPALKAADLGIAMGSGTEAAKSAAKMVILESNLSVITGAIRNGRIIADNVRKVITYLVSTSMSEIVLVSSSIVLGLPLPLLPIQILWINLVTDGVQDKTFPFIREEGDVMARPPKKPDRQFFDREQVTRILIFGFGTGILGLLVFIHLLGKYPYETAVSITFTAFVCMQWCNGLEAQTERESLFADPRRAFFTNPYIYLGVGVGVILQLFAVYGVPGMFGVVPLTPGMWLYVGGLVIAAFGILEGLKWMERRKTSGLG